MAPKHKRRRERKRLYKQIVEKQKQINHLTWVKLTRDAQKEQRLRKLFHGHTSQSGKIARARWRLDREQKQKHTGTWMRMHYSIVQEPVRIPSSAAERKKIRDKLGAKYCLKIRIRIRPPTPPPCQDDDTLIIMENADFYK